MKIDHRIPRWASKVPNAKIQRLYGSDANGILDEELVDEVGWALWSRYDSILQVTEAHYGRVICPACGAVISHYESNDQLKEHTTPWHNEDILHCGK